jgi:hypothetical protein
MLAGRRTHCIPEAPKGRPPGVVMAPIARCAVIGLLVKSLSLSADVSTHPLAGPWPAEVDIVRPTSVSFETPDVQVFRDRTVLRLKAPAELSWDLDGSQRDFRFDYGFEPPAYQEGNTNGVDITVELRHGEQVRQIFRRALSPRQNTEDQRYQLSRVVLPPYSAGTKLVLRFGPGPLNDNSWDWTYLCNVRFKRSDRFLPEQFPSFHPSPTSAQSDLATLYQNNGHPFYLQLHAPSTLAYVLRGRERHLQFNFGFFPGAYLNGGNTDGAKFVVELQRGSAPAAVLFQRALQPVQAPSDRGPQRAELSLPVVEAGDRLTVRIDPGASNAWDWTYISRLDLE